jgi:RNA polymerase sigma factor (sigma-70 family)
MRLGTLISTSQSSPSQHLRRREASVLLAEALASLSADYREVVLLRTLEDRPWSEVATWMGRSTDAARMLWVRAIKQLRFVLEERI